MTFSPLINKEPFYFDCNGKQKIMHYTPERKKKVNIIRKKYKKNRTERERKELDAFH